MFDRVAGRYDLLNSVMTAGLHHTWRVRAAERAEVGQGDSVLDVCCGTGDLAFELAGRVSPGGRVIGCDFSEPMLDLAREKGEKAGVESVRFEWADALQLPYDAGRFDAVTVGFGVRNFADWDRGLREMTRVLRPGGRLVVLEFTAPRRPPFSTFYSLWFDRIVPVLGRLTNDQNKQRKRMHRTVCRQDHHHHDGDDLYGHRQHDGSGNDQQESGCDAD